MAETLTTTELAVARMLVAGVKSADIAIARHRSRKTISSHIGAIKRKLGASTTWQAGALMRAYIDSIDFRQQPQLRAAA